jgi:hypothetical protein
MAIQKGIAVIFGVRPARPIVNIPSDALRVRIRMRSDDHCRAFVKFSDRIEHWIAGPADERTQDCDAWRLCMLQGINHAKQNAPQDA